LKTPSFYDGFTRLDKQLTIEVLNCKHDTQSLQLSIIPNAGTRKLVAAHDRLRSFSLQPGLSSEIIRKQKGSNNRHKARLKVARVHQEIADTRKDNLHKLTTRLVRENQTIAVEDLAVKNLIKNHKLALAISDAIWGELVRQLEYKCEWYGRNLIKIDRCFPSSKRCFECGYIVEKLPLNVREWECPNCGAHHDRDLNASKNILAAGLAVKVCGATVRPEQSKSVKAGAKNLNGRKQKPK
jgi:putative transposase